MPTITCRACAGFALLLLGCAQIPTPTNTSESAPRWQPCSAPRPEICTMNYAPVCGLRGEVWQTFSNACSACSNKEVIGYHSGECIAGR